MCEFLQSSWQAYSFAGAAAQSNTCAAIERRFESEKTVLAAPQISSLLFMASDNGCDALVGRSLQTGASVAAQDRVGGTALTHAARNGQTRLSRCSRF